MSNIHLQARSLHRLIYFSRQEFTPGCDIDHEVDGIIEKSIENNRAVNLTGLLLVHQEWFVQILEGSQVAVQTTYGRIVNDTRHSGNKVIAAGPAEARMFGNWNMCARRLNAADSAIISALDLRGRFDPNKLTPVTTLKLLTAVASIQDGQGRATAARLIPS